MNMRYKIKSIENIRDAACNFTVFLLFKHDRQIQEH